MKKLIIASTSTLHDGAYLDYLLPTLAAHFKDCSSIIFVPYAIPSGISYDQYTERVRVAFTKINKTIKGLHEFENPIKALENAEGIFTGGGNTFLLVTELYKNNVMDTLKKVVENGITTISTDFKKMGTTLAKMVLSNEQKQIENPSDLIIRNSL